jgi:hypothetical protein
MAVHLFGIRHHGPGSSRSLLAALNALGPDALLIEAPPEAEPLLPLLADPEMKPPVALLLYAADEPSLASFYPQAIFSPEWQAIQFAAKNNLPVTFIDLPQGIHFARTKELQAKAKSEEEAAAAARGTPQPEDPEDQPRAPEQDGAHDKTPQTDEAPGPIYDDPLAWLAKAAGFGDGESWWEHMVEYRRDPTEIFAAISEAMAALRKELPQQGSEESLLREQQREAHMRQSIRAAEKKFSKVAVVCGAWHVPALEKMPPAKDDGALLKDLVRLKVNATCIPWTHGRLAFQSGYRAGVDSPGWYHHLWTSKDAPIVRWLVKTARLLRKEDLDASSAHVIETVRLAETLASLRERPFPGLTELNEATLSVLCHGNDLPLQLIHRKLIVGDRMGTVPAKAPRVPLQQDVATEQKQARLKADAAAQDLDLDLRNDTDLRRSLLLHRLGVLGIAWGERRKALRVKGTFHELWHAAWEPEFEITLIERASWGNTLLAAASAYACHLADEAQHLSVLARLLEHCLPADLPRAVERVIVRVQDLAAVSADVFELMTAVPSLANIVRYGDVRATDTAMVAAIICGLLTRICVGLPGACASLNDEAAQIACKAISEVHAAVGLLQMNEMTAEWQQVLGKLATQSGLHGVVGGRCTRFLLQAAVLPMDEAGKHFGLALSRATDPTHSAAWCEGFLQDSGTLLVNDDTLWQIVDAWVSSLKEEHFQQQLPILRRTFASFQAPERRALGERVGRVDRPQIKSSRAAFDGQRAERALPLLAQLLGLKFNRAGGTE